MPSPENYISSQSQGEENLPAPFVETGVVVEQQLIQSVLHQGNRFSVFHDDSGYTIEAYNRAGERVAGFVVSQVVFDATLHGTENTLSRPTEEQSSQEDIDPYSLITWEKDESGHVETAIVEGRTITNDWGLLIVGEKTNRNRESTFEIDTELSLSSYTRNRLIQAGFRTVEDMRFGARHNILPHVKNLGEKGLREIEEAGFPLWHQKPRKK